MATGGGNEKRSLVLTAIAALIVIGGVVLAAGLAVVDFRAAAALVLGVAAAWGVVALVRSARRARRAAPVPAARGTGFGRLLPLALGVAGLIGVAVLVVLLVRPRAMVSFDADESPAGDASVDPEGIFEGAPQSLPLTVVVTGYRVSARPAPSGDTLLVNEVVIYDVRRGSEVLYGDQVMTIPEREVASRPRGFLLREVTIEPLGTGATASIPLELDDGTQVEMRLCRVFSCPPSEVEIQDFPQNAFYAAQNVAEVRSTPYVRTETVTWTTDDLDDGITFAYIPSPYHRLRPVLSPFLGAASLGDWLLGLVAMVGSILTAPLVGPLLEHLLDEYVLGDLFRRRERHANAPGEP
ncbi:MAG: hypothetical protein GX484_00650 [Chloroflexi bacterium]|nr:hypothetical protein [Chloroflexota bacterium]